jgi:hypothetical protein
MPLAVRRRRKFNIVVYSELKVNIVVWPEAKVIIAVRPEAEIFEPGWHRVICVPPNSDAMSNETIILYVMEYMNTCYKCVGLAGSALGVASVSMCAWLAKSQLGS